RRAGWYAEELRALIAPCRGPRGGGYTPGDFPLAGLDQEALDALLGSDRGAEDVYPLTPMQEGMLFHSLLAPGSGVYVGQFGLVLEGPLDVRALRAAWGGVLARHDALRAGFAWAGLDRPVQVVRREVELPFRVEDWRGEDPAGREARMERWLEADREAGFDPGRAPLMRLALFRVGDEEHRLVWTQHHLILDGWSLSLVFRDVLAGYAAHVRGEAPRAAHGARLREYVAWLERQDRGRAERFWKAALAGFDTPTPLPASGTPRSGGGGHGTAALLLSPERTDALHERARRLGVTPSTLLQGAWALLLSRYSGEDDVLFGATVSGRPAELPGAEETVGLFINTLPVRVRLKGEATLGEWLAELQREQVEAREYEYTPLVEVRKWSGVPSGQALFESLVVFENFPVDRALGERAGDLEGVRVRSGVAREQTHYPLSVQGSAGERLKVEIHHDRGLLEADAAERLAGHLDVLLETLAGDPVRRLFEVSLLRGAERAQVLETWNATAMPYYRGCVHELVAAQAARTPEAVAVVFADERVSYAGLDRRANALAHHLRRLGVEPETRVGVCLERTPELLVGMLGIWKAGGACVPLDPAYPAERLAWIAADAALPVVVAAGSAADALPEHGAALVRVDALAEEPGPLVDVPVHDTGLAYVIYTSGSTGRPKGVLVQHGSLANLLAATREAFGVGEGDVMPALASYAFDIWLFEALLPLTSGAAVRLVASERVPDIPALLEEVADATLLHAVPALMQQVVRVERGTPRLQRLRRVFVGGEAVPAGLLAEMREVFPTAETHVLYGPTEGTILASAAGVRADAAVEGHLLGRPLGNVRLYVCDSRGTLQPAGVPGELLIGGAGVARGYLGRPELTAEKFVPDAFGGEPGARLYRSGDRARWTAAGELEYLGRIDAQVKIRGFRIEPGEVEAALAALPAVREAAVAVREDVPGEKRLVGYVVPADGTVAAPAELRAQLAARLPEYMVPSALVVLESLPLTATGKTDRRALPAPEPGGGAGTEYVAPATAAEETLAGIWAEVLRLERVGVHDDFFERGGHSLLATQVISRARQAFGVEVPLRALFEAPTVAGLAGRVEALRSRGTSPARPMVRVPREEPLPLSFAQQRLWLVDRLEPGSAAYNLPVALRLRGSLCTAALRVCLDQLVRRHEALRTVFRERGGAPVQVVRPPAPVPLPVIDLRSLPGPRREAEAVRLAGREALRPFDLARGPLLRSTLLRLADDEHALLFTMHHVVSDGWSMDVLVREVSALYAGEPLPELPVQYADFAVWQRERLGGEVLEEQVGYWKARLAGAPPLLEIPTDRPRTTVQSPRAGSHDFRLSGEASRRLRELSHRESTTSFMTILAAWQALLGRYAGGEDVVVGSPIAGRTRREVEGLIGFFVNMLALRADLGGDPTWTELLRRTRETALGAYAHQELPFERLVDELSVERSLMHTPVFQVIFALNRAGGGGERLSLGDLELEPFGEEAGLAKFDLNLTVADAEQGVAGRLVYRAGLFDAETMARMVGHLEAVLEAMAAMPEQRLSEVSLMRGAERAEVLGAWNDTAVSYPQECVHELFARQAARTPGAVAVVSDAGTLTYAELECRSNQLAKHLRRRGVGVEVPVGLLLERSAEMVVGVLGILKTGGAYVPLDPASPPERLRRLLADAGAPVLCTQESLADRVEGFRGAVVRLDADAEALAGEPDGALAVHVDARSAAYIIYTSGSTGTPKGVVVEHGSLGNYLQFFDREVLGEESFALPLVSRLSFDAHVRQLFPPLLRGEAVWVLPESAAADPDALLEALGSRERVGFGGVPSLWSAVLERVERNGASAPRGVVAVLLG
ncbi:MAG TPA: amino acid adenylation domain-containing protein, partial [Longimicrobiaceae bacterium]